MATGLTTHSGALIASIDKAKKALSVAHSLPDVLDIRDKAKAIKEYVKASGESLALQNKAAEIKLRAERKAGELLAEMEKNPGGGDRSTGNGVLPVPSLSDLGISKMQSSRWQLVSKLPDEDFEELVIACNETGRELTQALLIGAARKLEKPSQQFHVHSVNDASGKHKEQEWKFIVGDCRKLPFPDDHFDLVFCSPPYESQREYEELAFSLSGEDWVEWAVACFEECLRVCKGLVAWVVEGFTSDFAYSSTPFLLMADLHRKGYKMRKPVVYKRNGIPGTGGPDWLRNDWEPVICATKNGKLPWSDNKAMGQPPKQNKPRVATNRCKDGTRKSVTYNDPDISNPGNVIEGLVGSGGMGWKDATQNEAPFPEWIADFFINSFCPPGGLVLDPFSGSGTTVSVAVRNGRSGVGVDARPSQVWLGETRLMGLSVAERKSGQGVLV